MLQLHNAMLFITSLSSDGHYPSSLSYVFHLNIDILFKMMNLNVFTYNMEDI
jgi:hypothetical protein